MHASYFSMLIRILVLHFCASVPSFSARWLRPCGCGCELLAAAPHLLSTKKGWPLPSSSSLRARASGPAVPMGSSSCSSSSRQSQGVGVCGCVGVCGGGIPSRQNSQNILHRQHTLQETTARVCCGGLQMLGSTPFPPSPPAQHRPPTFEHTIFTPSLGSHSAMKPCMTCGSSSSSSTGQGV
jgi:hypothetical protein